MSETPKWSHAIVFVDSLYKAILANTTPAFQLNDVMPAALRRIASNPRSSPLRLIVSLPLVLLLQLRRLDLRTLSSRLQDWILQVTWVLLEV